jgi:3-isopropylmalate/(R)-2-methylmalate dehydratase large subunit
MLSPNSLYGKLWDAHVVAQQPGHPALVYVDLHLVHDGTYRQAFELLEKNQLRVRRPDLTVGTTDHCLPTTDLSRPLPAVVTGLVKACEKHGIPVYGPDHEYQGIVHVIGPELGLTQPGKTVICADSHTTTHGALGALPFVVGTTQVLHALATQCVLQRRAREMRIEIHGALQRGVTVKDVILSIIRREGITAAAGHAVEFSGSTVRALSMDERMTLCNMTAELGARTALIAPDDKTLEYLRGRRFAPQGAAWEVAERRWRALKSDDGAHFDARLSVAASEVEPMVTWGSTPAMGVAVSGVVPEPAAVALGAQRDSMQKALGYMNLAPGTPAEQIPVDVVFIGSCTNSRIDDLRGAAAILRGRKIAPQVRLLVVPGSQAVRRQAEAEGLHDIFRAAGGEWGRPGCSLCVGMNDEFAGAGKYVASTSNRNFQGRQGPGARTLLVSPLTAAASALRGRITDPRKFLPA